jgi:gliding motility-associated-like protein
VGAGLAYSLDGGAYQSSVTFTNIASGSHTITVQNADGCISVLATIIVDPVPLTPAEPTTNVIQTTCSTTTATITITGPLGTGLTYNLDGGAYQSSATFNNVPTGNHTVTAQNADGCTSTPATVIVNPVPSTPAAATANITHPTCVTPTGSITITAPTDTGLTYSLNGGVYQSSVIFSNVAPGNHTVTVQNADGCTSTPVTVTVNPVPSVPAAATANVVHPTCTAPTGSITIATPLGAGLTYNLDGGAYQPSATFNNVTSGNHIITVKNADGCISAPATVTVDPTPSTPAAAVINISHPTCATPIGSITIVNPVGAGLTYSLDGGAYQSAITFNNVAPGNHIITVQGAAGCISTPATFTVNPVPSAPVAATVNIAPPTCTVATGSITVTNPVGPGLAYSMDGGAYQSSAVFSNIAPGTHTIIVQGVPGCISAPATFTINAVPSVPAAAIANVNHPTCTSTTGTITITSPLGSGLTYSLDEGVYQTSATFTDIASGSHTIAVKNAGGCTSVPVTVIVNPVPLIPANPVVSAVQPTCTLPTGKITISSPTGMGYQYSTDGINYQSSTTFNNLAPGIYTITVRNTTGCTSVSGTVTINNPPVSAPDPGTITVPDEVCLGDTTTLSNIVTGGIWSSNNNSVATVDANGVVTGVSAGTAVIRYTVGTTCSDWTEITIRVNPLPNPVLHNDYLCEDPITGGYPAIVLNSGLTSAQYSFVWKKGTTVLPETQGYLLVFEPGTYSVTATNLITGCTSQTVSATIGVSSIATATAEVRNDFDYRQSINVIVTGGSGSYEYSLDGGPFQASPVFTDIYEGEYTITVNDINGCGTITFTVFALNYPRYFSPNDDGYHDYWNINGLSEQRNARIHIFDRYGKVVASIKPSGIGWDGTYNGNRLPATDYWFTVYYTSSNGQEKEFKAHFSLIR